jgi:putative aminopeptidase FrvX
MNENCYNKEIINSIESEIKPLKIEVDFDEYQNLNKKLEETDKNLKVKIEIIAALIEIIGIMGSEEMKNKMFIKLAEIDKEGVTPPYSQY